MVVLALLALAAPVAQAQDVALRVGKVLPGGGQAPLDDATILIREGRIVAVGREVEIPAGVPVVERPRAWATAGFVDASTALGTLGDTDETAQPLQPDVSADWATNAGHRDFANARAAGVTTVAICPGDAEVFGGALAVRKTTGGAVRDAAAVKLSLGAAALRRDRPPTSRAGALHLLRTALIEAHGSEEDDWLTRFAHGWVPGLFALDDPGDVRAALDLRDRLGLTVVPLLRGSLAAGDLSGVPWGATPVLVGPFGVDSSPRRLRLPAALSKAGAQVGFVSEAPRGDQGGLRRSAALAVRYGLDPAAALAGLSEVPARALGIGERVGTLQAGLHGDVVLLDGSPLDLGAQVLEVYVEGNRVHPPAPGRIRRAR